MIEFKKLKSKMSDFGFHVDVLTSFSVSVLLVEFDILELKGISDYGFWYGPVWIVEFVE